MARQKITESMDYDDELPLLTEQDMAYVLARIEGKGQADAYRISHPDTTATPKSVWELASRVERRPQVQVWLRWGIRQGAIQAACTMETHLAELSALRDEAKLAGNYGAAVQAELNRGKAAGLYIERHLDMTKAKTADADALKALAELLGDKAAEDAARKMGMTLDAQATLQ